MFSRAGRVEGSRAERTIPAIQIAVPVHGGKARVAPEVWRRFGNVKNYVEPFFGGGGVLLNRPVWGGNRIETVNDLDGLLVNFWRAVKFHPTEAGEWRRITR